MTDQHGRRVLAETDEQDEAVARAAGPTTLDHHQALVARGVHPEAALAVALRLMGVTPDYAADATDQALMAARMPGEGDAA